MPDLTATEWFDQFPGPAPEAVWPQDSSWCPRHWAPCPVLGANGIGAATELMDAFLREIAPPNARSNAMLNRELAKAGRICCTLGDQRMYSLWQHWLPATQAAPAAAEGGAL